MKMEALKLALIKWSKAMKKKRRNIPQRLERRLVELIKGNQDDELMAELLDVKIQLNREMKKQEAY